MQTGARHRRMAEQSLSAAITVTAAANPEHTAENSEALPCRAVVMGFEASPRCSYANSSKQRVTLFTGSTEKARVIRLYFPRWDTLPTGTAQTNKVLQSQLLYLPLLNRLGERKVWSFPA